MRHLILLLTLLLLAAPALGAGAPETGYKGASRDAYVVKTEGELTAALVACGSGNNDNAAFPCRIDIVEPITLTDTVEIGLSGGLQRVGMEIACKGYGQSEGAPGAVGAGTMIFWDGPAGIPMFHIGSVQGGVIRGCSIYMQDASEAFLVGDSTRVVSNLVFDQVWVKGNATQNPQWGYRISGHDADGGSYDGTIAVATDSDTFTVASGVGASQFNAKCGNGYPAGTGDCIIMMTSGKAIGQWRRALNHAENTIEANFPWLTSNLPAAGDTFKVQSMVPGQLDADNEYAIDGNDQVDVIEWRGGGVRSTQTCIQQMSGQARMNRVNSFYCADWRSPMAGIWVMSGNMKIENSFFASNNAGPPGPAIRVQGPGNDGDQHTPGDIVIEGNDFELYSHNAIYIDAYTTFSDRILATQNVLNNRFYVVENGNGYFILTAKGARTVNFIGNSIICPATSAADFDFSTATNGRDLNWYGNTTLSTADTGCSDVPVVTIGANDYRINGEVTSTANSTAITNTTTEAAFDNCDDFAFAPDSMRVGDILKIKAGGIISSDGAAPGNISFRVRAGAASAGAAPSNANPLVIDLGPSATLPVSLSNDSWAFEGEVTVRSVGAGGTVVGVGSATVPASATDSSTIWDGLTGTTSIDMTATTYTAGLRFALFADWSVQDSDNTITAEYCSMALNRRP